MVWGLTAAATDGDPRSTCRSSYIRTRQPINIDTDPQPALAESRPTLDIDRTPGHQNSSDSRADSREKPVPADRRQFHRQKEFDSESGDG